jgi:uncharacterized 2Fe-2S/4Fe-4S cluster protein (DUF4445 family)
MGTISHDGESRPLAAGKTIFDYADDLAVRVATSCGRAGTCHECVVEVTAGTEALGPRTEPERFLKDPFRLACQVTIADRTGDVAFRPLRRTPKILTERQTPADENRPPTDPPVRRQGDTVWRGEQQLDGFRGHIYGLAIDVGTTTVAVELVDLQTGATVQIRSFGSPQLFAGSDVMNRVSYDGGEFTGELQDAIVTSINGAITDLVRGLDISRREIYEIVVAGNSTMRDLVFGLDVQGLGQKPYHSLVQDEYRAGQRSTTALEEPSRGLGLRVNPHGRVYGLPLIGSHVGGDMAADLLATQFDTQPGLSMLVDIGTNTEIVVRHGERMLAASSPAGPAFEGGLVGSGMPAYPGAIESLRWDGTQFEFHTIGEEAAQGICGSGLIDLLAELRRHDKMTAKGVFTHDRRAQEIVVVAEHDIRFSRLDASNLAQAKAANYCGQTIVCRELGVAPGDVDRLFLAGGFANYVDVENAITIGLLPPVPVERVKKVGNAALHGARQVLVSLGARAHVEAMVTNIDHIELETAPDFFEVFVDGCRLEPMQTGMQQ